MTPELWRAAAIGAGCGVALLAAVVLVAWAALRAAAATDREADERRTRQHEAANSLLIRRHRDFDKHGRSY